MIFSEQDKQVQEFLNKSGIKYNVQYLGAINHKEWAHDLFILSLAKTTGNSSIESFEFKTGVGHRFLTKIVGYKNSSLSYSPESLAAVKKHNELAGLRYGMYPVASVHPSVVVPAPTAASLIHSLILDGEADNMSFNYWCDSYGYDSDSIKASDIYRACIETSKKLRKIFTREQIKRLSEILEDY